MDEDTATGSLPEAEAEPHVPHAARLAALEEWLTSHVHNTVVSANELAVNRIHRAVAEIRAALNSVRE